MINYRDIILKYKVENNKQLTNKDLKDIITYFNINYKIKYLKDNYYDEDTSTIDYIRMIDYYYEEGFDLLYDLKMLKNIEAFEIYGSNEEGIIKRSLKLLTEDNLNDLMFDSLNYVDEKLLLNDFKKMCKHWYHKEANKFIADYEADILDNMIEDRVDVVDDIYKF